jgi:hypothetical protein
LARKIEKQILNYLLKFAECLEIRRLFAFDKIELDCAFNLHACGEISFFESKENSLAFEYTFSLNGLYT